MAVPSSLTFADLLHSYRLAAGLTQEDLAERAQLSVDAISTLERGIRRFPRKDTIALLADALALTPDERALLEAAARQHRLPFPVTPAPAPSRMSPGSETEEPQAAAAGPPTSLPPASSPSPTPGMRTSAEAGRDPGTEAAHSPTVQISPSPSPDDSLARPSAVLSSAQFAPAATHPRLRAHRRLVADAVSAPLLVALFAALLGGGFLYARGPGVGALFGQQSQPHGGKLCIASDFPTTGDGAVEGKPAQNAVQLAVVQNMNLGSGYTLDFVGYNDAKRPLFEDPEQGAKNVSDMVHTSCVMGMIGPWSSHIAAPEMPIAANAGLAMISPSNTAPGLTLRRYIVPSGYHFDQIHPLGKTINYFRIPPNDALQGKADADFTIGPSPAGLHARSSYVVKYPLEDYSDGLASAYTAEFLAKGGTILGTESIPLGSAGHVQSAGLAQLAARIEATRPQAVYYAGDTPDIAALLRAQLAEAGYMGPFVSDDGIALDPTFAGLASQTAGSVFATNPAPDLSTFTTGAAERFILEYQGWYPNQNLDGYSANAYDAAMILITAIRQVIRSGAAVTREAVIDQVQHIQYAGVTGPIAFDKNGDNSHAAFSLYTVKDGKWVYVKQLPT